MWKLGWIEFDGEKMVEEIQEKAKHINFEENSKKELIKLLDLEKYDDGYTSLIFYDGESGEYLFYGIEPKIWDSFVLDMFWYNDVAYYSGMNYRGEVKFQDTSKEVMICPVKVEDSIKRSDDLFPPSGNDRGSLFFRFPVSQYAAVSSGFDLCLEQDAVCRTVEGRDPCNVRGGFRASHHGERQGRNRYPCRKPERNASDAG